MYDPEHVDFAASSTNYDILKSLTLSAAQIALTKLSVLT